MNFSLWLIINITVHGNIYKFLMCQKCHGVTMNLTWQMIVQSKDGQTVTPKAKSDLLPLFVNKTSLDHCYTHLFKYCLWCFVLQWPIEYLPQRLHSQKSLKYLPSGPRQKKSLPFPHPDHKDNTRNQERI